MVEAALVLPLFFLAIGAIVEFGQGMMVSQLMTNAAREGARRAILDGSTNTGVEQHIENILVPTLNVTTTDIAVTITITPAPGNTTVDDNLVNIQSRDLVKVVTEVPFSKVSFVAGQWLTGTNLNGESTMRRE